MVELLKKKDYNSDVLEINENQTLEENFCLKKQFKLKPNISFLLFTSHTPCKFELLFFH